MKNFISGSIITFLTLHSQLSNGQSLQDTVLYLQEAVINNHRINNFANGNKVSAIDSLTLRNNSHTNMGDLLSRNSHAFIKSYGPGNLGSISMRGSGTSQVAVLWNGFNIQSPTLAQADFSLLPVSFADEISIQYGGAGALFGSSAVGGTIHLNNNATFSKGVSAEASVCFGGFSSYGQSLKLSISRRRWMSVLRIFNSNALNNFKFFNTTKPGNPLERQYHSQVVQKGILQENFFRIGKRQQLNFRAWIQDNFREIAPIMNGGIAQDLLKSKTYRFTSEWKHERQSTTFYVRSAVFNERMDFVQPVINKVSVTPAQTSISEAEGKFKIADNHLFNIGVNNTYNQSDADGYFHQKRQNRISVFASYKISNRSGSWHAVTSLREEFFRKQFLPVSPSLGFEGRLLKNISLKGNVSKNYKLPSFNDLYWYPSGNPDLLPESGWSEEVTAVLKTGSKHTQLNASITAYNSNITNCIVWLPIEAQGNSQQWTPLNIQHVWSRGIESDFKYSLQTGKMKIQVSMLYSYTLSTNEQSKIPGDNSVGKQLLYIPMYQAQGNFTMGYGHFFVKYNHVYTGNRFTSADNTKYIAGYMLGNLNAGYNLLWRSSTISFHGRINNIWNNTYQIVLLQPMPLRYYQIGISFVFNKPLNK